MQIGKKPYSVSLLAREAKSLLEASYLNIQVEGEISGLVRPASGHQYFNLKDDNAQLRCVFFKHNARLSPINLTNGMQVILSVRVSLYEQRGDFQLIVQAAVDAGEGLLRKQFEQLKLRLGNEGLFDLSSKKDLPPSPVRVGVITSSSGAVIHDIISVFKRRFPAINLLIYPTLVQGELAAAEIASTIATADQRSECDVIILARGGGSLEDLWPFNEELVARAIFQCQLPLVSAVGHESDFTISDLVADARAATPTAAAEMLSPDVAALTQQHTGLHNRLSNALIRQHERESQKLDQLQIRLSSFKQHISHARIHYDGIIKRFNFSFVSELKQKQHRLNTLKGRIQQPDEILQRLTLHCNNLHSSLSRITRNNLASSTQQFILQNRRLSKHLPDKIMQMKSIQQATFERRLFSRMPEIVISKRNQLENQAKTLQAISPLQTLARGFSSLQFLDKDEIISSTTQVKAGDEIQANLQDGSLLCKINKVNRYENE